MTQPFEITRPLTDEERQKVQAFAESLIAIRPHDSATPPPRYVNVDALSGMFAGLGGGKSDKELVREAWDDLGGTP